MSKTLGLLTAVLILVGTGCNKKKSLTVFGSERGIDPRLVVAMPPSPSVLTGKLSLSLNDEEQPGEEVKPAQNPIAVHKLCTEDVTFPGAKTPGVWVKNDATGEYQMCDGKDWHTAFIDPRINPGTSSVHWDTSTGRLLPQQMYAAQSATKDGLVPVYNIDGTGLANHFDPVTRQWLPTTSQYILEQARAQSQPAHFAYNFGAENRGLIMPSQQDPTNRLWVPSNVNYTNGGYQFDPRTFGNSPNQVAFDFRGGFNQLGTPMYVDNNFRPATGPVDLAQIFGAQFGKNAGNQGSGSVPGYRVMKFGATWCGPCAQMAPVLAAVCGERGLTPEEHDIDNEKELAKKWGVIGGEEEGIPAVIVLLDGVEISRSVGLQSPDALKALFNPPRR